MRSLQHVFWRGAMALGLFVGGGVLTLPHSPIAVHDASIAQPAAAAVDLVQVPPPASSARGRC
jgi:hypothetical protein